jgi:hypothetical protein
VLYRVRQFWRALSAQPDGQELAAAQAVLTPAQFALFCRMQPSEQAHSLGVLRQLYAQGSPSHELQVAALLHDAGKCLAPLRLWERAWIVLAEALAPGWAQRQGSQPLRPALPFWQRPLVVACQHAEWGAKLAEEAGASALVVAVIRRHQDKIDPADSRPEAALLRHLQAVDNRN